MYLYSYFKENGELLCAAVQKFSSHLKDLRPTHPVAEEFIAEDIHEMQLVKGIVNQFLICRLPQHAKLLNDNMHKNRMGLRQKLTKIIFNNQ